MLAPDQVAPQLKLTEWSQLDNGCGVDVAIETSGTQGGLTLAGQMPHEHGVLSIVGFHQGGLHQVDMASLITHRFGLDQVDDAFRALSAKPTGFIKATMVFGKPRVFAFRVTLRVTVDLC